jgi:hypothetical protein
MTAADIEKRKPLTRMQVIQLMLDQDGKCGCGCGVKLNPRTEGVIDEHRVPLAQGGSNDLENRHLYRKPCAVKKTEGKDGDNSRTAKAKRQGGETGQYARREARGGGSIPQRVDPWPPKGSRKLQSPGFDSSRTVGR